MATKTTPAGTSSGANSAARATAAMIMNPQAARQSALKLANSIVAGNAVAFSEEEIPLLILVANGYIRYSRKRTSGARGAAQPGQTSVHGGTAPRRAGRPRVAQAAAAGN